jgi:hypothetical protein
MTPVSTTVGTPTSTSTATLIPAEECDDTAEHTLRVGDP